MPQEWPPPLPPYLLLPPRRVSLIGPVYEQICSSPHTQNLTTRLRTKTAGHGGSAITSLLRRRGGYPNMFISLISSSMRPAMCRSCNNKDWSLLSFPIRIALTCPKDTCNCPGHLGQRNLSLVAPKVPASQSRFGFLLLRKTAQFQDDTNTSSHKTEP